MLVLVVDDELLTRMTHMVMLSHLPDVNAIGAGSVAEAKLLIAHHTPQLVLLDLELPDGTGLDVMNFLTQRELQVGLVIISAHLGTFRSKLRPSDRLHLLTKPLNKNDLQRVVKDVQLGTSRPSPFSLTDYIQLACMGQHTAVIECLSNDACGEVVIDKGIVWSAQDELGQGAEAFHRLLLSEGALLRVGAERVPKGPRSLFESWEALIFESMRLKDEAVRDQRRTKRGSNSPTTIPTPAPTPAAPTLAVPPSADHTPVTTPAATSTESPLTEPTAQAATTPDPDADFDSCVESGVRAVLARDFAGAIAKFERAHALRPKESMVIHRLERLRLLQAQRAMNSGSDLPERS